MRSVGIATQVGVTEVARCPECRTDVRRGVPECPTCGFAEPAKTTQSGMTMARQALVASLVGLVGGVVVLAIASAMEGSGPGLFGLPPLDTSADRAKSFVQSIGYMLLGSGGVLLLIATFKTFNK